MRLHRPRWHQIRGSVVATVGFVLSPLSWWNDLLVNVPLAFAFATVVGVFDRGLFLPALVVGYWLTNVLGFVMLHVGAVDALDEDHEPYTRRALATDLLLSIGYTILVVGLVEVGLLAYPEGLLP